MHSLCMYSTTLDGVCQEKYPPLTKVVVNVIIKIIDCSRSRDILDILGDMRNEITGSGRVFGF